MAEQSPMLQSPGRATHYSKRANLWMLALGMATYGAFYTGRQNFGVAAASLRADLHFSAIQLGTISASMLVAYALGGFASGYIADRFSPRLIVCIGAFLSLLLNWITSFANSYHQALFPWALNGFVQSAGWAPCNRLVMSWWPQAQRGFAVGMMLFAAGIASLVAYALSLGSLHFWGWRYVFRIPALTMLPAIALFYICARERQTGESSESDSNKTTHKAPEIWTHYSPLLKNWRFLSLCGSIGCESAVRYGLLVWVPVYLLGHDWHDNSVGAWLMLLLPLGMAFGGATTGFVSDRFFPRKRVQPIVILMLIGSVMTGSLYEARSFSLLLAGALMLVTGFTVYGPQASYWTVGAEIGGAKRRGAAIGMMDASAYLFAAMGEACIGWLVDRTGNTAIIFPTLACACLFSACLALPFMMKNNKDTEV